MIKSQRELKKWIAPLLSVVVLFCILIVAALVIALNIANKRLKNIASILEETVEQHIMADVELNTNIPLNSNFQINEAITVGINMMVETVIPINVEIPVNENMLVPFKIGVKDYIKLDTTIMISDDVYAIIEDTLYIDQKFTVPTSKKRGISVPIRAGIPLNERVKVSFNQAIPAQSVVPVDLLIIDTLAVGLNIRVPVDIKLPVRIPVNTTAEVSFPNFVPVTGDIPVSLKIPVDIALSETALALYLTNIAKGLRGLIKLNTAVPVLNEN